MTIFGTCRICRVHIFKSQTLKEVNFFLAQTCIFQFIWFSAFSWLNIITKFSKNLKNLKITKKKGFCIFNFRKKIKCMQHLPEVYRNCSCKTCWSTFLALLFERACCLYMPLHVTIRQWPSGHMTSSRPLIGQPPPTHSPLICFLQSG